MRMIMFFLVTRLQLNSFFFFFNDTATTEIYTLSLHDALPISPGSPSARDRSSTTSNGVGTKGGMRYATAKTQSADRKSTRLNSSHSQISYAVFCLKKKKKIITTLYHLQSQQLYTIHLLITTLI